MKISTAAEQTSETVRHLVDQLILKHERAALEIMIELKQEIEHLRKSESIWRERSILCGWKDGPGAG